MGVSSVQFSIIQLFVFFTKDEEAGGRHQKKEVVCQE